MSFIWATRGYSWGFRFLRAGGYSDPLPPFEEAFSGTEPTEELLLRGSAVVALRFWDPLGRTDQSGRIIPHEFVLLGAGWSAVTSLAAGVETVWPLVADEYADIWDQPELR